MFDMLGHQEKEIDWAARQFTYPFILYFLKV